MCENHEVFKNLLPQFFEQIIIKKVIFYHLRGLVCENFKLTSP